MKKALLFVLAFVLTLITVGCGEGNPAEVVVVPAEPVPLDVVIADSVTSLAYDSDTQEWICHFQLTASTTGGSSGDYASWRFSEVDKIVDGSTIYTWYYSVQDMLDFWGYDRILRRQTLTSYIQSSNAERVTWKYTLRMSMPAFSSDRRISVFVTC